MLIAIWIFFIKSALTTVMHIAIWMFISKSALTTSMYRNTHRNLSIFIVLHLPSLMTNEHCLTIKPQQNKFQRMIKMIWKGILWIVLNARNTVCILVQVFIGNSSSFGCASGRDLPILHNDPAADPWNVRREKVGFEPQGRLWYTIELLPWQLHWHCPWPLHPACSPPL